MVILGVDHGNSQVKTVHNVFVAGITEHGTAKPPIPTDVLYYNNCYYTVANSREPYKRDKTQDEKCYVMTLIAIAKELLATDQYKEGVIEVGLAVGLPPEHLAKQKRLFADYFKSHGEMIEFTFNDKPFKIKLLDVQVFPQAYAALATRASMLKAYSSAYIVDIGGYTVDVLLLTNGRPNLQACHSMELGIIQMNNMIISRVNSENGLKVGENHIQDILTNKPTILPQEIANLIKESAKQHAFKILNTLRESNIDLRANPAMFMGGGSLFLKDQILDSGLVNANFTEFFPEVTANAAGYTILMNTMQRTAPQ